MQDISISFGMFEPAPGATTPGKHYARPTKEGEPPQKTQGIFGVATYRTVTVTSPSGLIEIMRAAPPGSYIMQGIAKDVGATRCVPTVKLKDNPGAFARSNDYMIEPEAGTLVTVDYDPPQYPDLAPENMPTPSQQIGKIAGNVFMVNRPSTSAFIADAETGELYHGARGRHINLAVAHGSEREEQLDLLHKQCVLHGWCWPKIDSTGKVTVATIVDLALKRRVQPQFLSPVLGEGLVRAIPADSIRVANGGYLNIPTLTFDEEMEYERRVTALPKRPGVAAQAVQNRRQYVDKLKADGWGAESIKAALHASTLRGDVPLHIRVKGKPCVVTVRDVLASPASYHGADALDPVAYLEPDYANNYCARLYLADQKSTPTINSMAHGGRVFMLVNDAVADFAEAVPPESTEEKQPRSFDIEYPPGLVGEIARYILASSVMPVKMFAIAGALSAVSYLCRNTVYFGQMQTPFNLYQVLIGKTGGGKEDPRKAVKRLILATNDAFMSGVTENLSSGTALLRALHETDAMFVMSDEYGLFMQAAMSDRGDPNRRDLVKELMTLYGLGRSNYTGKRYANPKDNIPAIEHPYVCVLGTTTAEELFAGMNMAAVNNGSANRNIYISACEKVQKNRTPAIDVPEELASKLKTLFGDFAPDRVLGYGDGAGELIARFGNNQPTEGRFANLWSRAEENALRVAGVLALCDGGDIEVRHVEWAIKYISQSIEAFAIDAETQISENVFEKQMNKMLSIISDPYKYSDDKQFAAFTRKGQMPRGKLIKLMKVPARQLDDISNALVQSKQIYCGTVDGATVFWVLR